METKKEEILIPTKANINIVVKQVIGGGTHTILLTDSNILVCGSNEKGQLGKELSVSTLFSFESILCPFKIVKVSCGWDFNLALTETLDVIGWGSNSFGQLGLPTDTILKISSPRKIFEEKAVDIGAGLRHSVIISLKGVLLASGFGRKGQLGFYLNNVLPLKVENFTKGKNYNVPFKMKLNFKKIFNWIETLSVSSIDNFEKVSCGECHCVAATRNGQVYTWGNNKYGQLGIEPKGRASIIVPTPIKLSLGNIKVKEVHSGWAHNVILTGEFFKIIFLNLGFIFFAAWS